MYNYSQKEPFIQDDRTYARQLKAIFNNAEFMEGRYGDISDWITPQYEEYCARNHIFTRKSLSTFKSALKNGYISQLGKSADELDALRRKKVCDAAKYYNVKVYWYSPGELLQTIRNTLDQEEVCGIFVRNTIVTASLLLYCGLSFEEMTQIKRDDVVSHGIWSINLPTKIERQTMEAQLVMLYAKQNPFLVDEDTLGLPLLRGGNSGKNKFSLKNYTRLLSMIAVQSEYNITVRDILLSGEFGRIYKMYGEPLKDTDIFAPICKKDYVKINDPAEIRNLYELYCLLKK